MVVIRTIHGELSAEHPCLIYLSFDACRGGEAGAAAGAVGEDGGIVAVECCLGLCLLLQVRMLGEVIALIGAAAAVRHRGAELIAPRALSALP